MKKVFGEYYLGLDIGTNSVGWAVTDLDYNLLRFNGKDMWGIRLFKEGQTAETRRIKRSARRRLERSKNRISLLQELFAEEISKVDPAFYQRLEDSKFYPDDKEVQQKNTLFNDKDYKDKDYHKEFPTIYHLREALITETEREFDARLVYLAIAHILSHRGHFYYSGSSVSDLPSFDVLFEQLSHTYSDLFERDLPLDEIPRLQVIFKTSDSVTAKSKKIEEIVGKENKQLAKLLAGSKVNLALLFEDESYRDIEPKTIRLDGSEYDNYESELSAVLAERFALVEQAKALFDWGERAKILRSDNLSKDKIASYDKHKQDLRILKEAFWKHCGKDIYKDFFDNPGKREIQSKVSETANYPAYIGRSIAKPNKSVCSRNDFYKEITKWIPEDSDVANVDYIYREMEKGEFLPKQSTGDNSVIPFQFHLHELQIILKNAARYLPFLDEKDADGYSTAYKIEKLLTFRIPYFVGPLNDTHRDLYEKGDEKGNAWIIKKSDEKIYPWNFSAIVDTDKSQEQFIRRMTNKCTYLIGADVLPKQSILYSKYSVLNEINNLRVDGEPISVLLKQEIFTDLFLRFKKVSPKRVHAYLFSKGYVEEDAIITGVDEEIKSSMASYIDLKGIVGDLVDDTALMDQIITIAVIFGEEKKALENRLLKQFGDSLTKEQCKRIAGLRFSGWGRLSAELLKDIYHTRKDTGEVVSIIRMMWETNDNFMELMTADKYDYVHEIRKHNREQQEDKLEFSYEDMVEPLYCSPAVKRSVWQALQIVRELKGILGHEPNRLFVEVTRGEGEKKPSISRKKRLQALYENCKKEAPVLGEQLAKYSEGQLRSKKLYLYYTQMGRCMYSGEEIRFEEINDTKYYEIDHIYPRSLTKDNSFDNLVLVKSELNTKKEDVFPIPESFQNGKTRNLWHILKIKGLISAEKYERLNRTAKLTDHELAGFINRQLVETSQSSKAAAEALQKYFQKAEIVYVKSGHVADFRQEKKMIKVRELNDLHHAKDAYLNIVVGNVYHTKFTRSPAVFIKEFRKKKEEPYPLKHLFKRNVNRGGVTAWVKGEEGTIHTVKRVMQKNTIQFTRLAYEETGAFYDEMPMKKGNGQIPLKSADPRLHNTERYGAYNKDAGAYFILVEHTRGKSRVRTIEYVPIRIAAVLQNEEEIRDYCAAAAPYGLALKNPKVLLQKIKFDTLFRINGFPFYITSRTGSSLVFKSGVQLFITQEYADYFRPIIKFINKKKLWKDPDLKITPNDNIDREKTAKCYDLLVEKANSSIWRKRPNIQNELLSKGKEKFAVLPLEQQCELIVNVLQLFSASSAGSGGTDLTLIGGSKQAGTLRRSNNITKEEQVLIIHQSPTGLFEQRIDAKKL